MTSTAGAPQRSLPRETMAAHVGPCGAAQQCHNAWSGAWNGARNGARRFARVVHTEVPGGAPPWGHKLALVPGNFPEDLRWCPKFYNV